MDDTEEPDNVLSFPKTAVRSSSFASSPEMDHEHFVRTRKTVYRCVEGLMEDIENDEEIIGVVCLAFKKDNSMNDVMAGDISASHLYVMLDKVKMEVMDIITEAAEE